MKGKLADLFIFIAVLSVTALAVSYSGPVSKENSYCIKALPRADTIKTATPQHRDFVETCRWFGKVKSRDKVRIIALETGTIVSLTARDGMPVTRGELLFTIGGPLIRSRLEVLRNKSAALRKRITLTQQIVKIKRDAASQKLAKYEEVVSAEDALARLRTELESAEQERKRLQKAIHIRAGIAGVLANRKVSAGQEVKKGDDLAEIISQDHIYIEATLFPQKGAELHGKQAIINPAGGGSISGTITTVLPQRTAEGAVAVFIEGPDLAPALRPGQTATGTVILSVHKKALSVPEDAIIRDDQERACVFLKNPSGYCRQPVKTGISSNGRVEIISGLTEKDEVVVQGAYELFYRNFNKIYKVAD